MNDYDLFLSNSLDSNRNDCTDSENLDINHNNCTSAYSSKQQSKHFECSRTNFDKFNINGDHLFKDDLFNDKAIKDEVQQSVLIRNLDEILSNLSNLNKIRNSILEEDRPSEQTHTERTDYLRTENDLSEQILPGLRPYKGDERILNEVPSNNETESTLAELNFNDVNETDATESKLFTTESKIFTRSNEINLVPSISTIDELDDRAKSNPIDPDYSFIYPTDEIKELDDLDNLDNRLNESLMNQTLLNDLELSSDSDSEVKHSFKRKLGCDKTDLRDVYRIEKILGKRSRPSGRLDYLVKYENLDDDQLVWEHERNLNSKLIKEFNDKYGNKLLVADIPKETKLKYFDSCIDEESQTDDVSNLELNDLIAKSIEKPLCDIYKNIKPERIIGIYEHENKKYYLIKWNKLEKADLYECSKFKERFPNTVLDYYLERIMFCDLEEKQKSDPIKKNKRVRLN